MDSPVAERLCAIRAKMQDRIGANRYRTWFSGCAELLLDGERLDVTVPNAFVGDWITSNFMPHLVAAARDVIGAEPRVEIRIDGASRPAGPAPVARREVPEARAADTQPAADAMLLPGARAPRRREPFSAGCAVSTPPTASCCTGRAARVPNRPPPVPASS